MILLRPHPPLLSLIAKSSIAIIIIIIDPNFKDFFKSLILIITNTTHKESYLERNEGMKVERRTRGCRGQVKVRLSLTKNTLLDWRASTSIVAPRVKLGPWLRLGREWERKLDQWWQWLEWTTWLDHFSLKSKGSWRMKERGRWGSGLSGLRGGLVLGASTVLISLWVVKVGECHKRSSQSSPFSMNTRWTVGIMVCKTEKYEKFGWEIQIEHQNKSKLSKKTNPSTQIKSKRSVVLGLNKKWLVEHCQLISNILGPHPILEQQSDLL